MTVMRGGREREAKVKGFMTDVIRRPPVYWAAANWPGILSAARRVYDALRSLGQGTFDTRGGRRGTPPWCPAKLKKLHFRDHVPTVGGTAAEIRVKSLKLM